MEKRYDILLVTQEAATADKISSALGGSNLLKIAGTCSEVSELRSHLSNKKVQAIVVDIDPEPTRILYELAKVLVAYPKIYVVVVCSHFTKELALQAMQAGVRHFLEKNNIESRLTQELQQLIQGNAETEAGLGAAVITIFSASGGCGATTVAINLTNELQLLSSRPALLIDLDSYYGTVSDYLGIKSEYGIADVLDRKGLIDRHLIQSSAYAYMNNYHVLPSPISVKVPKDTPLQFKNFPRVLEACREVYQYTIIDAPRMQEADAVRLAGLSDIVIVVFQLMVRDVNFARSMVLSLNKSGISSDKIISIVNRITKRGQSIRLEDGKKAVGLKSCLTIRSDWRRVIKCVTKAQPLAQVVKKSGIHKDYQNLAATISSYGINDSSSKFKVMKND